MHVVVMRRSVCVGMMWMWSLYIVTVAPKTVPIFCHFGMINLE